MVNSRAKEPRSHTILGGRRARDRKCHHLLAMDSLPIPWELIGRGRSPERTARGEVRPKRDFTNFGKNSGREFQPDFKTICAIDIGLNTQTRRAHAGWSRGSDLIHGNTDRSECVTSAQCLGSRHRLVVVERHRRADFSDIGLKRYLICSISSRRRSKVH